jgi:hypothetical protein
MTNTDTRIEHTPGPWGVETWAEPVGLPADGPMWVHCIRAADDSVIADIKDIDLLGEINARLMASAPDLLAALEALAEACGRGYDEGEPPHMHEIMDAHAAIKRARGEE